MSASTPAPLTLPATLRCVGRTARVLRSAVRTLAVSIACIAPPACVISPQPVPPPDELQPPPAIQTALVSVTDDGTGAGGVIVRGQPGAVAPAADAIRTLNRVSPSPAVEVVVNPDGSFEAWLMGTSKDSFRLQARRDTVYSLPVDVQGSEGGTVVELEPPYGGCVLVEPAKEVVFPSTPVGSVELAPVRVTNTCPFEITLSSFASLSGNPVFEPMAGLSSQGFVPQGGETLLGVAFRPMQSGLFEDDFLLEFLAQPPDPPPDPALLPRWIVTVRGLSPMP